jgi:O-antigen/teichoic acid export membrane protein
MLLVVADLGLHSLVIREISRDEKKLTQKFQQVFVIKIILSVVFLGLVWSIVNILEYSDNVNF